MNLKLRIKKIESYMSEQSQQQLKNFYKDTDMTKLEQSNKNRILFNRYEVGWYIAGYITGMLALAVGMLFAINIFFD